MLYQCMRHNMCRCHRIRNRSLDLFLCKRFTQMGKIINYLLCATTAIIIFIKDKHLQFNKTIVTTKSIYVIYPEHLFFKN